MNRLNCDALFIPLSNTDVEVDTSRRCNGHGKQSEVLTRDSRSRLTSVDNFLSLSKLALSSPISLPIKSTKLLPRFYSAERVNEVKDLKHKSPKARHFVTMDKVELESYKRGEISCDNLEIVPPKEAPINLTWLVLFTVLICLVSVLVDDLFFAQAPGDGRQVSTISDNSFISSSSFEMGFSSDSSKDDIGEASIGKRDLINIVVSLQKNPKERQIFVNGGAAFLLIVIIAIWVSSAFITYKNNLKGNKAYKVYSPSRSCKSNRKSSDSSIFVDSQFESSSSMRSISLSNV